MVTPYDFCSCSRTASPEKDTTTSVVIIHPFKNGTMRAMITVPSFIDAVPLFSLTFHKITPGEGAGARFEQLDLHSGSMLTCPVDVSGARPGQLWCDATYRVPRRAI